LESMKKNKYSLTEIEVEVFDKNANLIGEKKFYNLPNELFLSNWIEKPKANKEEVVSLSNAVSPTKTKSGSTKWSDNAIAHFVCDSNDFQNASTYTLLLSSAQGIGHKGAVYVTKENLWQVAIVFTIRRLIKPTWLNNRDQFLQPTQPLSNDFKIDCLIWMLFNGSNLTASANNLEWNGKQWSIVNHFIPFTEQEVNSPDRFESNFMVNYLLDKQLTNEAAAIMLEGKKLWQTYFAEIDARSVRDEFKLNRVDVGWYQIRKALQARNISGDYVQVDFKPFEEAYKTLTEKLQPMVYELGFLKR